MLEVRLFGKFEVKHNGKPVAIPSRTAQSLFAYLILTAGTSHRREKLAGLLWPDSLEETARDNLRHALWRIRKALPSGPSTEYLFTDDLSIAFNAFAEYRLDAAELEKAGEGASADELIAVLSEYKGELLPGFYDEWVVLERERLNSTFEHHMARLMSLLQAEKRWLEILDWGEHWIRLGQKPEPAYRALMSAHAAKGDMSRVAAVYGRCVRSLKESGIEPSEQTRALYERLKAGKEVLEAGPAVPVKEKRRASPKTNLPIPLTSFIGREKDVREILKLLGRNRLITLTGSGGVGKTRLAIESASQVLSRFRDGVWWVDLVGLNDLSLVPQAVLTAVNAREVTNKPLIEMLAEHFRLKRSLLVLDNCEHLISACAQLADRLLSSCRKLKILATSREALDILGETVWHVPSLSLPARDESPALRLLSRYEGIRLFADRAKSVQPRFELAEQNAQSVLQICHRLDGMPLAIELAAARVKMMSVDEIAKRLDDRFDLLTTGSRTALPRHQTLHAAIDWSYNLLSEPEKILFRHLSVFMGGFTLEAAQAVAAGEGIAGPQIVDQLGQLLNKSLIRVDARSASASETRYNMLETIREYARGVLDSFAETDFVRDRHLDFFVRFAEQAETNFMTFAQFNWHARLGTELDNLRHAMEWSVTLDSAGAGDGENPRLQAGLRLAGALYWIWDDRDFPNETSLWVKDILSKTRQPTPFRARALMSLGVLYATLNDFAEARPCFEEALAICRSLNNPLLLAMSLTYRGAIDEAEANYVSAQSFLKQGLEIAEELKIVPLVGWNLSLLADTILMQGNRARAKELYERSAEIFKDIRHRDLRAYQLRRLGYLAMNEGKFAEALQRFRESLEMNHATQFQYGIIASLTAYARLALAENKITRAAKLYGIVDGRLSAVAYRLYLMDEVEYEGGKIALRAKLDEKTIAQFWARGRAMTLEKAVVSALKGP